MGFVKATKIATQQLDNYALILIRTLSLLNSAIDPRARVGCYPGDIWPVKANCHVSRAGFFRLKAESSTH
jgi:hypothetical protein